METQSVTAAPVDFTDTGERALVTSAKQQAKRLLRLAKKGELKVTALSQALEITAQMHGYPNWKAFSQSTGQAPTINAQLGGSNQAAMVSESADIFDPVSLKMPVAQTNKVQAVRINPPRHLDDLASRMKTVGEKGSSVSSVLTIHFEELRSNMGSGPAFINLDQILQTNPFLCPLGSDEMLPMHLQMVTEVLLSVEAVDQKIEQVLSQAMRKAIQIAFRIRGRSDRDIYGLSQSLPDGLSVQAQSLMGESIHKEGAIGSFYEAADRLIEAGLMEDAWKCHVLAMPKTTDLITAINSHQFRKFLGNNEIHDGQTIKDRLGRIIEKWCFTNHSPWSIPMDGLAVFEINPQPQKISLPAQARWMLASLMAQYRRLSIEVVNYENNIKQYLYDQTDCGEWMLSVPVAVRNRVIGWHRKQHVKQLGGVDLMDEMDGPLRSEPINRMLEVQMREARKEGRGVWVATREIYKSDFVVGSQCVLAEK